MVNSTNARMQQVSQGLPDMNTTILQVAQTEADHDKHLVRLEEKIVDLELRLNTYTSQLESKLAALEETH